MTRYHFLMSRIYPYTNKADTHTHTFDLIRKLTVLYTKKQILKG